MAHNFRDQRLTRVGLLILYTSISSTFLQAQWRPTGDLARVPVIEDCRITGGDIAVVRNTPQGVAIFKCQPSVDRINSAHPGAAHFYYVHEFGHIALGHNIAIGRFDEPEADCWAAEELADITEGERILKAAIAHFLSRNDYHPRYGHSRDRARRIAECSGIDLDDEEVDDGYGRSCCGRGFKCGPFLNQAPLPIGAPCSCQYGNPWASGRVCKP